MCSNYEATVFNITAIPEYIVQGHRFDILEDVGCFPATYNTPPAYALTLAWPVAIGAVSLVYCGEL